ncbi:helix-turn-helix domain-containing protein [Aeromicrobium phragmitis]|uniref:helix-turn-helix domain-containing protein n=1 Tax=Aeromicrobium phragmitis TaxID=2478914 RepID=UPI001408ECC6|nr:helix-turn-helix domain-containing protein [Aeromicrobium phragmitis]
MASSRDLSPTRLTHLSEQIRRAVLTAAGAQDDQLVHEVVHAAVTAFVEEGEARTAAARVAPLMDRLGRRQARRGSDAAALFESFRAARIATQRGLSAVIGEAITGSVVIRLREELMSYLAFLFSHARAGLELERERIERAELERPRRTTAPPALTSSQRRALARLRDGEQLVVLTAVTEPLPIALCHQPGVAADDERQTALAPAAWCAEQLCEWLDGQAVLGPAVTINDAIAAVALVRRAAGMLADGTIEDPRRLVPFEDLLGAMLLASNPVLNELMIAKHFASWGPMPASRRVALAEFLQLWLERGQPTNQLARELGIPPQTAHSRMKAVRQLLGEALDDPTQRLELMVALRAILPRWRS